MSCPHHFPSGWGMLSGTPFDCFEVVPRGLRYKSLSVLLNEDRMIEVLGFALEPADVRTALTLWRDGWTGSLYDLVATAQILN